MRVSRLWVLPGVACAAFMLSCESSPDSVAGLDDIPPVRFAPAPCEPDDQRGRCRVDPGPSESATVELSDSYSTPSGPQDIVFEQNGRRAVVKTADEQQITYKLDITLPFVAASCDWSGVNDAVAAKVFWDEFLFDTDTQQDDQLRHFLIRVNKKALGQEAGEHRTEARWFVQGGPLGKVLYLVKAGTPGDLLGSPHATGDFVDNNGTKTLTITGGAVRLTKCNLTQNAFGCGPKAEKVEVACVNPLPSDPDRDKRKNAQVFTATVATP